MVEAKEIKTTFDVKDVTWFSKEELKIFLKYLKDKPNYTKINIPLIEERYGGY